MELADYPTLIDVKKSIDKLNRTGFPQFNEDDDVRKFAQNIEKMLTEEFGIIHSPITLLQQKNFRLPFFRVRELEAFTNINLIREHSYPPLNVVGMGRCNFPKFPVFYCSDNPGTALLEVVRNSDNVNKKYCISKWEIQPSEDEIVFQNFLQTDLPAENNYKTIQEIIKAKINEPFQKSLNAGLDKSRTEGLLEYLTFLDSSFINDSNYSLSASLAYRSLFAEHNYRTDVLMYPSVQTEFQGINLALNPNFVENNLRLARLYEVSLENSDLNSGSINLTLYRYAEVEKNIIVWKNILSTDDNYNDIIKQDFGQLIKSGFERNN